MSERHREPYDSVLDLIGWTPMLRLSSVVDGARTPVYVKLEFMGPGGSIKDRIGIAMIEAAEREGTLKAGGTVVEATGICTMPDKMSSEKVKLLRAFGAEVVITPTAVPPDHPDHYLQKARAITAATPGAVMADQFYNEANPQIHYETTGREIWEQSGGRVTHFVASAGTGGTITGVGRYLKEKNPAVRIVGIDPEGSITAPFFNTGEVGESTPYKVEGIGNDKIPGTLDLDVVDDYRVLPDQAAFAMARRMTREEGLFAGGSAGLMVHGAIELAKQIDDPNAFVVSLVCDWGERYLSKVYDDEWMRENGFLERSRHTTARDLIDKKISDAPELITVEPGTSIRIALSTITAHDIGQLPVVSDGSCVGSVTETSLMSQVLVDTALLDRPVDSVMAPPFPVIADHVDSEEVRTLLTRGNAACLVSANGQLVGIVTRYDVVRALTA